MIQRIHEVTTGSRLIGIHGKAGAGKDTVCHYLHENYQNCWREAFADPLKKAAAAAFGIDFDSFNDPDLKELTDEYWQVSPRKIAQFLGTEVFRDTIPKLLPDGSNDFWIRRLTGTINGTLNCPIAGDRLVYDSTDTIVITDVRFQNEIDWVEANGGTILVLDRDVQSPAGGIPGHSSEPSKPLEINMQGENAGWLIVNNGTLEELYHEVDTFASYRGLIPTEKTKYDSSNF